MFTTPSPRRRPWLLAAILAIPVGASTIAWAAAGDISPAPPSGFYRSQSPSSPDTPPGDEGGVAAPDCGSTVLTQSTDPVSIEVGNTLTCAIQFVFTYENFVARVFTPDTDFEMGCVEFGVDKNIGGASSVEVTVFDGNIVSNPAAPPLAQVVVPVANNTVGQLFQATLPPGIVIPAGGVCSIQLRTPNRNPSAGGDGGEIYLASNNNGQGAPSYIKAAACGANNYVTFASIGYPEVHIVMSLGGETTPETLVAGGFPYAPEGNASLSLVDGVLIAQRQNGVEPYGVVIDLGTKTSGAGSNGVRWTLGGGRNIAAEFRSGGAVDRVGLLGTGPQTMTLDTSFAPPTAAMFDVWVFDGDALVGILEDQTSRSVGIEVLAGGVAEPLIDVTVTLTITCGWKKGTYKFDLGLDAAPPIEVSGGDGDPVFVGDSFLIFPTSLPPAGLPAPTELALLFEGVAQVDMPVGALPPGIIFGDTDTQPTIANDVLLTAGGVITTVLPNSTNVALAGADIGGDGVADLVVILGDAAPSAPEGCSMELGGVTTFGLDVDFDWNGGLPASITIGRGGVDGRNSNGSTKGKSVAFHEGEDKIVFEWETFWTLENGVAEPWVALVEDNGVVVLEIAGGAEDSVFGSTSAWPVAYSLGSAPNAEIVAELAPGTLFYAVDSTNGIPVDRLRMRSAGEPWLEPIEQASLTSQGIDVLRLSNPVATLPRGTSCPADLTNDGVVDGADLGIMLGSWSAGGSADLDGSGTVDGGDLGLLLGAWGTCL